MTTSEEEKREQLSEEGGLVEEGLFYKDHDLIWERDECFDGDWDKMTEFLRNRAEGTDGNPNITWEIRQNCRRSLVRVLHLQSGGEIGEEAAGELTNTIREELENFMKKDKATKRKTSRNARRERLEKEAEKFLANNTETDDEVMKRLQLRCKNEFNGNWMIFENDLAYIAKKSKDPRKRVMAQLDLRFIQQHFSGEEIIDK